MADERDNIKTADTTNTEPKEPSTDEIIAAVQAALAKSIQENMKEEDSQTEEPSAELDLQNEIGKEVSKVEEAVETVSAETEENVVEAAFALNEDALSRRPKVKSEEVSEKAAVVTEEAADAIEAAVLDTAQEEIKIPDFDFSQVFESETTAVDDAAETAEETIAAVKDSADNVADTVTETTEETVETVEEIVDNAASAADNTAETASIYKDPESAPSTNTEIIRDLQVKIGEAVKEDRQAKEEAAKAARAKKIQNRNKAIVRRRAVLSGIVVVILAVIIGLISLFRAGTWEDRAEVNTLTLKEDGSVVYEEILSLESASKKEVKAYVEEQIAAYNEAAGEEKVTLERFASGNEGFYVRMAYSDSAAYADFTGYWFTTGSVQSSINAGITFPEVMISVEEGEKKDSVTASDVQKESSLKLLTIQENTTVIVPGTIKYVTDECTTIDSESAVTITALEDDADAAALTFIVYEQEASEEEQ